MEINTDKILLQRQISTVKKRLNEEDLATPTRQELTRRLKELQADLENLKNG